MLSTKTRLYKSLFHKSFFFDKFFLKNVFQCPKITFLQLKFFNSTAKVTLNKVQFAKLFLLFYLLTGQRPQLLTKYCNLRSAQRKKVMGLLLTLHNYMYFFNFLTHRQLALLTPEYFASKLISRKALTLSISHKIHDDDIFYQALKLIDLLPYQITLNSNALSKAHFQALLVSFKVPCTL